MLGIGWIMVLAGCGWNPFGGGDLSVTHPAPGEALLAGSRVEVAWRPADDVDRVDLWFVRTEGEPLRVARGVDDSGAWTWTVPLHDGAGSNRGLLEVVPAGEVPASRGELRDQHEGDDAVALAALGAVRWNGTEEEYYWIDTTDGSTTVKGIVGDLKFLSVFGSMVAGGGRVYVKGEPAGGSPWKLYTLDAASGELLSDPGVPGLAAITLAGVADDGIVGFRWNGSAEEMVLVDPDDGEVTVRGTVGDLAMWSQEAAIDPERDRAYVFGSNGGDRQKVYTLRLSDGALLADERTSWGDRQDVSPAGVFVDSEGDLHAFAWDGDTERMLRIDPDAGEMTSVAPVGDLKFWSNVAAWNGTNDEVYVLGTNASDPADTGLAGGDGGDHLYVLDAAEEAFLYQVPVADYPSEAVFVY